MSGRWNRLGLKLGAFEHFLRLRVEFEARQHFLVADAAARILIHDLDQLHDRVLAIAYDMTGRASSGGDQFPIDHQKTMVVALQKRLDDHRAGMFLGDRKALHDLNALLKQRKIL